MTGGSLMAPATGATERVCIPAGVNDLGSFRRWALSDDFPEDVRASYLDGVVWVDPSMERGFSHNDVKHEVAGVLRRLTRSERTGRYFGDGMRVSHSGANLSTDPDGVFVSFATQDAG